MNSAGIAKAAVRRRQRTSASIPVMCCSGPQDLGLVDEAQLIVAQRIAQVVFQLQPAAAFSLMRLEKYENWSRPECLAWYSAVSACIISARASLDILREQRDADAQRHVQRMRVGHDRLAHGQQHLLVRRVRRRAGRCRRSSSTTNSSPPCRLTVSSSRTAASRRRETSCRTRSPIWWPSESLIVLK